MDDDHILTVKNLKTYFHLREGTLKAVNDVSFNIKRGTVLGVVGESGCGKSIMARSILRMIKKPGTTEGEINLHVKNGTKVNLVDLNANGKEIRNIRGRDVNMIFQEPMNAFSPVHSIGDQIIEGLLLNTNLNKKQAHDFTIELLENVGIPNPEERINDYSFQLSGGMRQRAMIAMAISSRPELIIADEPTTALDVSIQAQILKLLKDIQRENGISMIFITHDLAVVSQMADRVIVMYLGQIVEEASVDDIFFNSKHPYTRKLLESIVDLSHEFGDRRLKTIEGAVPEPINLPEQCSFYNRCDAAKDDRCLSGIPPLIEIEKGHKVRCVLVDAETELKGKMI